MDGERPEYQRFIKPALEFLSGSNRYYYFDEISEYLSERLEIPIEELDRKLPSGRQTLFENQLQWALSYLEQDGLIDSDGANAFKAVNKFQTHLHKHYGNPLHTKQSRQEDVILSGQAGTQGFGEDERCFTNQNPEQVILEQYGLLYQKVSDELMKRIHSHPPQFFENLIIDLLLAMKYGDRRRDLQQHLGRSGDGGVDGSIKQDQLGLDTIYIQAKRYRPGLAVPVSSVRDFAGALQAHKATKGVFVTTSHFTRAAHDFVGAVSGKIVLINGEKLAGLLIRNNIGVRVSETWEIKNIDEEYFSKILQK